VAGEAGKSSEEGLMDYYDKQGKPMELLEWGKLFEDFSYKRVAEDTLPDGKWVSTVWLGLNHQYGGGPPLIFETMVFPSRDKLDELHCQRYSTEEEAVSGHKAIVEKWAVPA
jgi:hypothetical protein